MLYANHFEVFSNLFGDHMPSQERSHLKNGKKNSIFSNNTFNKNFKNKNLPTPPHRLRTECLKNPFTKGKRQKNLPFPQNIHLYYIKLFSKATYLMSYLLPIVEFSNAIKFKTLNLVTFLPI